MRGIKVILVLIVTLTTTYGGLYTPVITNSLQYNPHPKYAFDYSVQDPHTGDAKSQWETRDGDFVRGQYSVVEPDGTVRVVEYTADDKNGFQAVVKKTKPSRHYATFPISYHDDYTGYNHV